MIRFFRFFMLVVACMVMFSPQAGLAASSVFSEYEVKAAYLYNFAKFVEWPAAVFPNENSPLTMCIAGKSPLNEAIETLAGKTIKNRRLVVRQCSKADDFSECQILFVNATIKSSLTQQIPSLNFRSILTVSESKGFAAAGGIIEFVTAGDKIRFEINNRAAQRANLRISSHLLRLATSVLE